MLYEFLQENHDTILEMTEKKTFVITGVRPQSDQLKKGLPIFYNQLVNVLRLEGTPPPRPPANVIAIAKGAAESDEPAMAKAAGHLDEMEVAEEAGLHGRELLRLGYTLSHVVHSYGAMCQAITELATLKHSPIAPSEFQDLNRCLDVAIAGAVTEYQSLQNAQEMDREVKHLGFLAHELRNTLTSVTVSLDLIKRGTVGFAGSTGQVLDRGLKRFGELIDRSLTEVRLRVDPQVHPEKGTLLQMIDQIALTAEVEADSKNQSLDIQVDPTLEFVADQPLVYSAISNLVQNALKFTPTGGIIQVRGRAEGESVIVEVEDECGGLLPSVTNEVLFEPFEQKNKNRSGLGLGLTIARRAIELNHGTLEVRNLAGKGCIFKISIPRTPKE